MKNSKVQIGLLYGGITSLLSILIGFALSSFGLSDMSSGGNGWVNALILILGIYLCSEAFKKVNDGYMSSSELIQMSLYIGVVVGLISGIFSWIYLTYIDPEMMDKIYRMAEIKMEEQGNSDEQIEMATDLMKKFMSPPFLIGIGLIMNLLFSLILGAVLSLFLKNDRPVF